MTHCPVLSESPGLKFDVYPIKVKCSLVSDVEEKSPSFAYGFAERSRWFLAELIVIVAGVLIALAIDQWRGNLAESQRELAYLEQLTSDLRATEEMMTAAARSNSPAEAAAGRIVALFETDMIGNGDDIRQLLADIRFLDNPVPVLGTAEALVSTGDLRLIQNPTIRSELTRYLSRSRDFWLYPIYQMEEQHRRTHFQLVVLAQRYGISPQYRGGLFRSAKSFASRPNIDGFLKDPEAYAYAAKIAELHSTLLSWRSGMSSEAAELRELIKHELSSE
jgi:hypothetical protein